MKSRFYDPQIGRFLQPDSKACPERSRRVPDYANPQSLNRYSYVLNNPLRYTDPTGHDAQYVNCNDRGSCDELQQLALAIVSIYENNLNAYGCSYTSSLGIACAASEMVTSNPVGGNGNSISRLVDMHIPVPRAPDPSLCGEDYECYVTLTTRLKEWGDTYGPKARDLWGAVERFATLDCLGFALDVGGSLATAAGPIGVPVAAALFAGSAGIDFYQSDFVGAGTSTGAWMTEPLTFSEFAPLTQTLAKRAGYAAVAASFASCTLSAN